MHLAVVLRRLMAVAKDVADNATVALADAEAAAAKEDTVGPNKAVLHRRGEKEKADRVRDEVEAYCERFEKKVLLIFNRSYAKGNPTMMADCAKVLQDFNGGTACVQSYVNQLDFFISKDKLLEDVAQTEAEM